MKIMGIISLTTQKDETMSELVCRVQDSEGRGPYRPNFSHLWSERVSGPEPFMVAFPNILAKIDRIMSQRDGSAGCAFRTMKQALAWFSPNEILKLATLGYSLCWMFVDEILAENEDQVVVWSQKPFTDTIVHEGWSQPPNG